MYNKSMNELINNKKVQNLLKPLLNKGFKVKDIQDSWTTPVYLENHNKDVNVIAVGKVSEITNEQAKKYGYDGRAGHERINFFTIELESDTQAGYLEFKVLDGIHVVNGVCKVKNQEIKLVSVGLIDKKHLLEGDYNYYNQKEWKSVLKYSSKFK